MRRILFVDDEQKILDGLRRLLHPMRAEWEMHFALGGEAAKAEIERGEFDVVVSDMRMPGLDGADLLAFAKARQPQAARIILSGYSEQEASLRAVAVAHRFLNKPCDPKLLREAIECAHGLQELLHEPEVRKMVGEVTSLPALPRIYTALNEALMNPDCSMSQIAQIVEQDVGLTAKVLQIVNSAFFGLPRQVSDIASAVSYLGSNAIRGMALSVSVFDAFERACRVSGFTLDAFQQHALSTAAVARKVYERREGHQHVMVAALLHDVGQLVFAVQRAETFGAMFKASRERGEPLTELESREWKVTHAEVGAYLLGLWGLATTEVEAVAYHHAPWLRPRVEFGVPDAVYVAEGLLREIQAEDTARSWAVEGGPLDEEYLERLGVRGQLPLWREAASEAVGAPARAG